MITIKYKIIKLGIVIFSVFLIIALYFLIKDFWQYKEYNNEIENLITNVVENTNEDIKFNWQDLKNINKDIIGWVQIKDTNINYPILKDNKNLIYLRHSYTKEYNKNGSIFTINDNPFIDNVTAIYGHNMKSGLMFNNLDKYMDKDFFYNHLTFNIYTEYENYIGIIFSAYSTNVYDEEKNLKSLDFEDEVKYYIKMSKYQNKDVGNIEKIVKLSTCSYLNNKTVPTTQRYYIIASLQKI